MTATLPAAPTLYQEFSVQAQIDAQYNPSIALADPTAPGKHFVAQSLLARATLKHHLDVPFGPTVHETLDIFPADAPNAPVFVFIHGGYWRALSSKEFSGVALGLQRRGITTVVMNYALCPWVTIDEITGLDAAQHRPVRRRPGARSRGWAFGGRPPDGHVPANRLGARLWPGT